MAELDLAKWEYKIKSGMDVAIMAQISDICDYMKRISADIKAKTDKALSVVCTEETVKDLKKIRASLKKEFGEWEENRKVLKKSILRPYEVFESAYKEYISVPFTTADSVMKQKIDAVENDLKQQKQEHLRSFFDKTCKELGVPFLTLEQTGIKVGLSSGEKELEEQALAFAEAVARELTVIASFGDDANEIRYEYERTLNLARSVETVKNRKAAIASASSSCESDANREIFENKVKTTLWDELFGDDDADFAYDDDTCGVPFEKPKKEYTVVFSCTEDEWRSLLLKISGYTYTVKSCEQ
ncbi:MAG: DUF1351 domain-containing protein [Eubacteriales bacterium]